ncbi:hypothetical protein B0T09DRAFT_1226 [Sordaria sp. MPI-SDFR-AT-0083]|nr:hypothetical protein B0T09DRAFT_1226 [Sordaria sp. MPI-SDFR-AT-0083]
MEGPSGIQEDHSRKSAGTTCGPALALRGKSLESPKKSKIRRCSSGHGINGSIGKGHTTKGAFQYQTVAAWGLRPAEGTRGTYQFYHCQRKSTTCQATAQRKKRENLTFTFRSNPPVPSISFVKMAVASKHGVAIFGQSERTATISGFFGFSPQLLECLVPMHGRQ